MVCFHSFDSTFVHYLFICIRTYIIFRDIHTCNRCFYYHYIMIYYCCCFLLVFVLVECDIGSYGVDCRESCGHCRDIHQCSNINGTCLTGCNAGYQGVLCKTREYIFIHLFIILSQDKLVTFSQQYLC